MVSGQACQRFKTGFAAKGAPFQPAEELLEGFPDGFTMRSVPRRENWWRDAASDLSAGKMFTIDYGFGAEELLRPGTRRRERCALIIDNGSATNAGESRRTGYHGACELHRDSGVGEAAGLKTETLVESGKISHADSRATWKYRNTFSEWTPAADEAISDADASGASRANISRAGPVPSE